MHAVVETKAFKSAATACGMVEAEIAALVDVLANNPMAGDMIPGTGGARKVRFARPGKGKRGGYRVITFFAGDDIPVFLMDVYAKGEKVNLTGAETNTLKTLLRTFAVTYRQSTAAKVRNLRG